MGLERHRRKRKVAMEAKKTSRGHSPFLACMRSGRGVESGCRRGGGVGSALVKLGGGAVVALALTHANRALKIAADYAWTHPSHPAYLFHANGRRTRRRDAIYKKMSDKGALRSGCQTRTRPGLLTQR
ncbi:hypothetical protein K491DRAFT_466866 [Lophiostoma macrostomum CBS 122681]|uniref:Uncharacterized protein n=1 Tax=Lophiostoma macrostomum CBS 122681 TaxID=1314788 RepID=A0A6A6T3H4_9PLEO|nr:hypothetical protein K491DRAFT_466866 [Lophiostoma macrostomum CBS 122681]